MHLTDVLHIYPNLYRFYGLLVGVHMTLSLLLKNDSIPLKMPRIWSPKLGMIEVFCCLIA